MTKEEFSRIAMKLKAIYTDPKFIPDKYSMEAWYESFQCIDYMQCQAAVAEYIATSSYIPRPSDILSIIAKHAEPKDSDNPEIAWSHVSKAIQNGNYGAEEEFKKLSKAEREAIGSPANIRELAQMNLETVNSVEKSHFIRNYRTIREREKSDASLPQNIRLMIDNASPQKVEETKKPMIEARPAQETRRELTDKEKDLSRYYRDQIGVNK